jgi:hypothetical protein
MSSLSSHLFIAQAAVVLTPGVNALTYLPQANKPCNSWCRGFDMESLLS